MIRKSKYIKILEREDSKYVVYHSLLGNACLMDKYALDLLDYFEIPNDEETLYNKIRKNVKEEEVKAFINELEQRMFLVDNDLEERRYLEEDKEYRRRNCSSGYLSRVLQLITSNTCNFRCKYCFEKSMYKNPTRLKHQNDEKNMYMSFDVAKKAMDEMLMTLKKNGNKTLTVEFFGGEPLTNWLVIKQVLEFYGNGNDECRIVYSITTNGSLITEEMAQMFKKYNVTVTISFDSPQSTERVRLDGKSALEILIPKLKLLAAYNNWVTFNSVLSKETIASFDEIGLVDFAKENNVSMIGLILDLDLKFYESEINKEEVLYKIFETYKYAKSNQIEVVGYWHQIFNQIVGKQGIIFQTGYKTCPATGCKISVEPRGYVYICKCCSEYLGEINKFEDVLKSDMFKEYSMRAYTNSEECVGCEIEGFCSGVCMGGLEKKYEKLYGIEQSSCDVFKEITRKLLRDVDEADIDELYLENDILV